MGIHSLRDEEGLARDQSRRVWGGIEWNLEKHEWSNDRKNSKKPYISLELTCPSLLFLRAILRTCESSPNCSSWSLQGKDGMLIPVRTPCARAHTRMQPWRVVADEIADLKVDFADPQAESNADDVRSDLRTMLTVLFVMAEKAGIPYSDITDAIAASR